MRCRLVMASDLRELMPSRRSECDRKVEPEEGDEDVDAGFEPFTAPQVAAVDE